VHTKSTLGLAIRNARVSLGLRQKDMAAKIGTANLTVSRWEQGKSVPRPIQAAAILRLCERLPEETRNRLSSELSLVGVVVDPLMLQMDEAKTPSLDDNLAAVYEAVKASARSGGQGTVKLIQMVRNVTQTAEVRGMTLYELNIALAGFLFLSGKD
jgi:transcriptional regulator with XRE-family HTH domain